MDTTKESPVILSLCTGLLRGLEIGIEHALQQRIRIAAYAEIEAVIVENLLCGMEKDILDAAPIWTNLKTFPYSEFRGKVHGIIGGYPCQPFSHVGRQQGTEDPRHLWPYIKDGIDAVRPVFCFFENVSNHINIGYEQVKADLEGLGYTVEQGIYSAQEVGSTHIRKRLFILALDNSVCGRYGGQEVEVCPRGQSAILPGKVMDDTFTERLQRYVRNGDSSKRWHEQAGSTTQTGFPMGQGIEQFAWEAPRVESRMGCTINGYNFREDLLRGLGNGVVWQTASLAFTDLLSKF